MTKMKKNCKGNGEKKANKSEKKGEKQSQNS